jgi:hypothetical protein
VNDEAGLAELLKGHDAVISSVMLVVTLCNYLGMSPTLSPVLPVVKDGVPMAE